MQRPKIDLATATKVRVKMHDCAAKGTDVIRALDELGFLSFEGLEDFRRCETIEAAASLLEMLSVDAIAAGLRDPFGQRLRVPATPQATKDAIVEWLRNIARDQIKPTQEETRK